MDLFFREQFLYSSRCILLMMTSTISIKKLNIIILDGLIKSIINQLFIF